MACGSDNPVSEPPPTSNTLPVLSMQELTVSEGDQDKSIFISLRLDKVSDDAVTVTLKTNDVTATDGEDYESINNVEIIFGAGDVQEDCQIKLLANDEAEPDEFFELEVVSIDGAEIGQNKIKITIEDDDVDGDIFIPNSGYTTPDNYDGMTLLWSDEFDAASVNEDDWCFEIGNGDWGWGNNELEFYRKENTLIENGHLVIQAREQNYGGFNYTSSRMITKGKFNFTHGRVDIRAVLPEGQGIWPALWMLGENISSVGWPRCGEIDIMELIGHQASTVHGTVHYANSNGDRIMNGTSRSLSGGEKFSEEFHVFTIVWKEDSIDWFLDDQKFHGVSRSSLGTSNPYPFNNDFFFIFNVAVGGTWPGSPDGSTIFPQNMIVDYIRVFQED